MIRVDPLYAGHDRKTGAPKWTASSVDLVFGSNSDDAVTVQYQTSFGSAVAGRDYFPASGTLTFDPTVTQQSFPVATLDDTKYQGARSVQVELFNPTGGAALGIPSIARVEILDSES